MRAEFKQRLHKALAFSLAGWLIVSMPLSLLAEESVSIDVNNPPPEAVMDTDTAELIKNGQEREAEEQRQQQEQQQSQEQARQPSAAVVAAIKAVAEGDAAVNSAKNEKNKMEDGLQEAQDVKSDLMVVRSQINDAVSQLDSEIQDVTDNLNEIEQLLSEKEDELASTSAKLIQARADAETQYNSMKVRIKFMYEKGTTDFIQILLGCSSFGDMLNKAEYIEQLSAYDRDKLDDYEKTRDTMAELETLLEEQTSVLEQTKREVENKRKEVEKLVNSKMEELDKYNKEIADKEAAIEEYEAMIQEQDETIKELEEAAKAARERQLAAIAADLGMGVSSNAVKYSGGTFCWPAPAYTRISDDYGNRIHPILGVEKFHNGIDMAAPSGSPILAAADGYVVAAAYSATMGNYIMIDHGDGIYTIYMHASALYVSADSIVKRGDTIGAVGSTGRSTGAHLHFSVRVNGNYVSPWSYLKG